MKTAAVILAAGRGSRLKELTAQRPKCLTELAGKALLHWQLQALRHAGIADMLVVRGYAGQCITGDFATVGNPRWAESNMLASLLCARSFIERCFADGCEQLVISYADIVYHPDHVRALLASDGDVAMTYDTRWQELWSLRFGDPLLDAETFHQHKGLLTGIGEKPQSLADIEGQYMGLLRVTACGWHKVCTACQALGQAVDYTDMTSFLQYLLQKHIPISTVPVAGRWCEVDTGEDLQQYHAALQSGHWSHDWRF